MGRPVTLLERICAHSLSFDAESVEVERKEGREWVFLNKGASRIGIANWARSSADAKELLRNLHAAAKKPFRSVIGGRVRILKVRVFDRFGGDAFEVSMDPAPKLDPSIAPSFTAKQGQYLAFTYNYTKIHRQAPAESDLERYFRVSPPAIHDMIKTLERNGLIERTPGQARSIRLLVPPEHLPRLACRRQVQAGGRGISQPLPAGTRLPRLQRGPLTCAAPGSDHPLLRPVEG